MNASVDAPKFTVITVVYENLDGLRKTAESVLSQIYHDYEWLVVDGASNDGTSDFVDSLNLKKLKFISEPDEGLYDAMNKGLALAQGEYIIFLNGGDRFASENTLERLSRIATGKVDFIYGHAFEEDLEGGLFLKKLRKFTYAWYGMFTHHQAMVYGASLTLGESFDLDYDIASDYAFTLNCLAKSKSNVAADFPICIFEQGGISQSDRQFEAALEQWDIRKKLLGYGFFRLSLIFGVQFLIRKIRSIAPKFYNFFRFE